MHAGHPARKVADRVPVAFPIKVMGVNADGFVHAVTEIARQFDPGFDAATIELRPSSGAQVPGRDDHRHRHQPRAARRAVPDAVDAPDGQGGALSDRPALRRRRIDRQARSAGSPTTCALRRDARLHRGARRRDTPDEIWLCEHPPVFTLGIAGRPEHVLDAGDIPVVQTTAAARSPTTGPGQVVAYPLVDLRRLGIYVKEYVFRLEQALLEDAGSARRHRPPRAPARPASTSGRTTRPATRRCRAAAAHGRRRRRSFAGLAKIAAHRRQGQPALHLPRRGAQRGDGPAPVRAASIPCGYAGLRPSTFLQSACTRAWRRASPRLARRRSSPRLP